MDYKTATIAEMEARKAEIAELINTEDADLDALEEEVRGINAELEARRDAATKKAEIRAAVAAGAGTEKDNPTKEGRKMDLKEIRSSAAYVEAFANYVKTGDDKECRALLSDNVQSPLVGSVPVPVFVEGIVAEELRASEIMRRVRKTYAKGNVKVGFEVSAPIATVHAEGGDPQTEEALVLGIVTLVPETLKKWVSISDEALDTMSGEAYLRYIYEEISRGIVKAREKAVCDAILNAPQTATATAPAVAKTGSAAGAGWLTGAFCTAVPHAEQNTASSGSSLPHL